MIPSDAIIDCHAKILSDPEIQHLIKKTELRESGMMSSPLFLSPFEVDFIGGFDSYGYQPPQKSSHLQLQPLYT